LFFIHFIGIIMKNKNTFSFFCLMKTFLFFAGERFFIALSVSFLLLFFAFSAHAEEGAEIYLWESFRCTSENSIQKCGYFQGMTCTDYIDLFQCQDSCDELAPGCYTARAECSSFASSGSCESWDVQGEVTEDENGNILCKAGFMSSVERDETGNVTAFACYYDPSKFDYDGDGLTDNFDNCHMESNSNQQNHDGDAKGNACDEDDDNDGILDDQDNCPVDSNQDQEDNEGDGIGDVCDDDDDNDGILDDQDNCPIVPNPHQENSDDDELGNACDEDDDNDGILDDQDNCPVDSNQDQEDNEGDGIGDVCDDDDDNDGILDDQDNCPIVPNPDQENSDDDELGNACDDDDDNDGILDEADQCPETPAGEGVDENGCADSQKDTDGDGVTDEADQCPETPAGEGVDENGCADSQKDTDGDGVTDEADQCPETPAGEGVDENGCADSQKDTDGDGVTDEADQCPETPAGEGVDENGCADSQKDTDGDGVTDEADQCPETPAGEGVDENGCADSQKDTDGDGVTDEADQCPETPAGEGVDENGCADSQKDTDGDGVTDEADQCPETPAGEGVDENGCADSQKDTDGDGVTDEADQCPETPAGEGVDENGCADSQKDTDGDGETDDPDEPGPIPPLPGCNLINRVINNLPSRFASVVDIFGDNELLLNVFQCNKGSVFFSAGKDDEDYYIWKEMYYSKDGQKWFTEPLNLTGDNESGGWVIGEGSAETTFTNEEIDLVNYVAIYYCVWTDSEWKCGCTDTECTGRSAQKWSLHSFQGDQYEDQEEGGDDEKFGFMGIAITEIDSTGTPVHCGAPLEISDSDPIFNNDVISCGDDFFPVCADGYRRVLLGDDTLSLGSRIRTYACEIMTEPTQDDTFFRGQLYGHAVIRISQDSVTLCQGPRGEEMQYPMSCGQDNTPVCADGFRRILFGTVLTPQGDHEKFFACERILGEYPNELQEGSFYSLAATVREKSGDIYSLCQGPRGEPLQSPMSCNTDNKPACETGFHLVSTGIGPADDPENVEQYFTCVAR
jgi:hypothetical protein